MTFTKRLTTWLKDNCSYAFLETYGFDGFDIRKKWVATSQGIGKKPGKRGYDEFWRAKTDRNEFPYRLHIGLIIASFLGFPSRLFRVTHTDDHKPIYTLKLDWLQFARGWIGGWDPIEVNGKYEWTTKKIWQVVLFFPFKFPIIFLFKVLTFPIKLLINIAKLITEFLPTVLVFIFGPPLSYAWSQFVNTLTDKSLGISKFPLSLPYLLLTVLVLIPFLISRAIKFFGMTLTSPDKSARMSYTWVYKSIRPLLKIVGVNKNSRVGRGLSFTLGAQAAILSILTSAGLWAIAFPMIIGAIFTYFPALLNAFAWLGQFPIVTSAITALESALAVVGVGTAAAYGAFIATLSGFMSVQVTGMMLLVGTAFGALAAPVGSILSRLADVVCDWWATWRKDPLGAHLRALVPSTKHKMTAGDIPLSSMYFVSEYALELVSASDDDFNLAAESSDKAAASEDRAEKEWGRLLDNRKEYKAISPSRDFESSEYGR